MSDRAARRVPWRAQVGRFGALAALLLLLAVNAAITPHFLEWSTISVNLTQVATTVIVATGMTLVIATGGIDLSVGSLMAIAGALAPLIFGGTLLGLPPGLGVAAAFVLPVAVTAALGWLNGVFVTRFAIQPIIATLILFIAGRGIAQVLTNGNLQTFSNPAFQVIGLGRVAGVPVQVILAAVAAGGAAFILLRTLFGRHILAVGGNPRAARLSGVPEGRVMRRVYAISGALAGVAGLVVVAINSASDANSNGVGMELDAIAAVAVGGTPLAGGRALVVGTVLGALIIQLVRYMLLANGVPDSAAMVAKAAIIVLAVAFQVRGRRA